MFKTLTELNEYLYDYYQDEEITIFTNPSYHTAFIGVSDDNRAVYDYNKMVNYLVENDDMEEIEAMEFIDYNTVRALPYIENPPIIIFPVEN